jgi:hypothetical protein
MDVQAFLNKVAAEYRQFQREILQFRGEQKAFRDACANQPQSPTAEIDSIPGRRLFYGLAGTQNFTTANDGLRGNPIQMLVSQDGAFIMTHLPVVGWFPSGPSNATNFGRWSPIYSYPVPTQDVAAQDFIDISWEFADGGSQRNLQNLPLPPALSRFDSLIPLPVPSLFTPNTVLTFTPTYNNIAFDSTVATPTTQGTLVIYCSGYRAVNV